MFRGVPEGGALGGYKGLLGGDLEILLLEDWGVLPCRGAVRWTPVGGGRGGGGVFWSPLLHVCPPLPPGAMPLARSMSVSSLPGLEDWGGPPENAVLFEVAWEVANKGERPLPPPLPRPPVTPDPPVTPP